jgi:hypothetical protein
VPVTQRREAKQSFFGSWRPDDEAAQPRRLNRAAQYGSKKELLPLHNSVIFTRLSSSAVEQDQWTA